MGPLLGIVDCGASGGSGVSLQEGGLKSGARVGSIVMLCRPELGGEGRFRFLAYRRSVL